MKNIIFFTLLMIFCRITMTAQVNQVYQFKSGAPVQEWNLGTERLVNEKGEPQYTSQGWRFKIEKEAEDGFIISFLPWKNNYSAANRASLNTENAILNMQFFGNQNQKKYFFITKKDFYEMAKKDETPPKNSFTVGTVTIPIKIRFGSKDCKGNRERYFDFYGDVNLGLSAGYKLRVSRNEKLFLNFLGGVSITAVSVDSLTTHGYIQTSTKASALTPFLGAIFEIKGFQFGVFTGIDYLARELGDKWDYKNQLWLGIGLGYSIYKTPEQPKRQDW